MDETLPAPEVRGGLSITPRVVEKVAVLAASEVAGVVPVTSLLGRVISRDLPRADADLAGRRTRIRVEVAASWPTPLPALAASVRDAVTSRVQQLVSLSVDGVSVTVASVVHASESGRGVT